LRHVDIIPKIQSEGQPEDGFKPSTTVVGLGDVPGQIMDRIVDSYELLGTSPLLLKIF